MTLDRLSNSLWNIIKLDLRRKNVLRYSLDSLESMLLGLYAFGLNAECIQSNTGNYGPQKKLRIWTFSRSVKSWVSACMSTTINRGQLYAVQQITKVNIFLFWIDISRLTSNMINKIYTYAAICWTLPSNFAETFDPPLLLAKVFTI